MWFTFTIVVTLFQLGAPEPVSEDIRKRFNAAATDADRIQSTRGIDAAIRIFEDGLADPENADYGQFHLRLGQLYKRVGQFSKAAHHFTRCIEDDRVDSVDRDIICQTGYDQVTAILHVDDLPADGRVIVIEPTLFAGEFRSGGRLPMGRLRLVVEVPGRKTRESTLNFDGPQRWRAELGMMERKGPLIPQEFVDTPVQRRMDTELSVGQPVRWPAYTSAGVGAVLLGTGLVLGFDNQVVLQNIRTREAANRCGADACVADLDQARRTAAVADGLWISGAVVMASAVALYFLFDAEPEAPEP